MAQSNMATAMQVLLDEDRITEEPLIQVKSAQKNKDSVHDEPKSVKEQDASSTNENTAANTSLVSSSSSLSNKSGGPPGSGLNNGVLQVNRQQKTCYGRELWDCLTVLESNTKTRTKEMENIKDLFAAIRKGLENFSAQITHSTQIYKRK